ncbi:MAG: nucleoid-associated protein [Bacteroidetes bacterium]|nr:nucleoid-associated protein [Bacteroidota bacterium]
MNTTSIGKMNKLIVHFVGNKNNGDGVRFSSAETEFEKVEEHFSQLIQNSFNFEEICAFHFLPKVTLNPVYQFVTSIFEDRASFVEQSQNAARILYDKSTHPKIKGGELQVAYFTGCSIGDKTVDAIAFFKSENKETFLKVLTSKKGFDLESDIGIGVKKLDKGCIIFNTKAKDGYLVAVVDHTNRGEEAQYWKDEFLSVQPVANEFHQTNEFLGIAKNFVTKQLSEEFNVTKADQIDLLNRSVDYFKTHESFDKEEFEKEVFHDPGMINSFRNFDSNYRQENEIEITDNFDISPQAVKKQARVFKSVLKLDKNFHIYIHGDRNLIEQGVENDGRKFYKIYYKEER